MQTMYDDGVGKALRITTLEEVLRVTTEPDFNLVR